MNKEHLQRLEWAKQEVHTRVNEIDEQHKKREIGGIEHKILIHERLFGRDKQEILKHIDSQISETQTHLRDQREIKIAAIVMLSVLILAFASTFIAQNGDHPFAPEAPTGLAVHESAPDEIILTDCWNNTPPTESHTTPKECTPEEKLDKLEDK